MVKVIQINNLKKVFFTKGNKSRIEAIENISLDVNSREFISIVGPTGCGKTTLLKLIGSILEPTSGEILIKGKPAKYVRLQKEFGFVFQKPLLLPWRTVIQNVCLPLEIINKTPHKPNNVRRAKKILRMVDLLDFKDNLPNELSGGMQQRVSIAMALVFEPPFLLMDEPFSALDEITRDYMDMELLRIWRTLKPTILYVTHSIEKAVFLADKVFVLTDRPAKIKAVIDVNLPRPRTTKIRYSKECISIIKEIACLLKDK